MEGYDDDGYRRDSPHEQARNTQMPTRMFASMIAGHGYGLVEHGQFQCYVAEFERR